MPRSVRIAIVTSCVFAVLGVLSVPVWTIDVLRDSAATWWLSGALGVRDVRLLLFNPMYAQAFVVVLASVRRDARTRELAFQLALLGALLLGFVAAAVSIAAAVQRRFDAEFTGTLGIFGSASLLAWALSRPSAKAWFAAGTGDDRKVSPAG